MRFLYPKPNPVVYPIVFHLLLHYLYLGSIFIHLGPGISGISTVSGIVTSDTRESRNRKKSEDPISDQNLLRGEVQWDGSSSRPISKVAFTKGRIVGVVGDRIVDSIALRSDPTALRSARSARGAISVSEVHNKLDSDSIPESVSRTPIPDSQNVDKDKQKDIETNLIEERSQGEITTHADSGSQEQQEVTLSSTSSQQEFTALQNPYPYITAQRRHSGTKSRTKEKSGTKSGTEASDGESSSKGGDSSETVDEEQSSNPALDNPSGEKEDSDEDSKDSDSSVHSNDSTDSDDRMSSDDTNSDSDTTIPDDTNSDKTILTPTNPPTRIEDENWYAYPDTLSQDYASGDKERRSLKASKIACVADPNCKAITCWPHGDNKCTLRGSSTRDASRIGEVTYMLPGVRVGKIDGISIWWYMLPGVRVGKVDDFIIHQDCALRKKAGECSKITSRTECLTTNESRNKQIGGMQDIKGQRCVWCGGKPCRPEHSDGLCEAQNFVDNGNRGGGNGGKGGVDYEICAEGIDYSRGNLGVNYDICAEATVSPCDNFQVSDSAKETSSEETGSNEEDYSTIPTCRSTKTNCMSAGCDGKKMSEVDAKEYVMKLHPDSCGCYKGEEKQKPNANLITVKLTSIAMSSDYDPREYPASLCDGRCAVANRGGQLVGCHSKNSTDPWIVGVFGGNMSVTGLMIYSRGYSDRIDHAKIDVYSNHNKWETCKKDIGKISKDGTWVFCSSNGGSKDGKPHALKGAKVRISLKGKGKILNFLGFSVYARPPGWKPYNTDQGKPSKKKLGSRRPAKTPANTSANATGNSTSTNSNTTEKNFFEKLLSALEGDGGAFHWVGIGILVLVVGCAVLGYMSGGGEDGAGTDGKKEGEGDADEEGGGDGDYGDYGDADGEEDEAAF